MVVSLLTDRQTLIKELLRIDDKQGHIVPFDFSNYKAQEYFHRNKSHRNIILKHRQGGITSSYLADMFMDCITIPHTQCAVVSHETRATQRLLDRVQFYYDTMLPPKPMIGAESRSEKTFPLMHSSIYVGTAGSRAFGRGDTIRKVLLSELSFYEDGRTILNGLEDAVPLTGELTIECTPNGEENVFHEEWIKAREGKSPYKPFFFPWWWTADYQIPLGSGYALPADIGELTFTDEEQDLVTRNSLTEAQIRWRRWKIAEKQGLFWQEYPENEVDCFITVGDPVFDSQVLTDFANNCYEGKRQPSGWLQWLPVDFKLRYVIGADTSSGAPEGSYSAFVVLNDRWEVCATFQGRVEPHAFAAILKEVGTLYNNAELAIERNFTGYAVLEQLKDYGNVSLQRDFTTGKLTTQRGWWTNDQTRSMMMSITRESLAKTKMWDVNLVRQLRSYRYMKIKTKYREQAQTFDDLAMAFMLAVTVRKVAGTARGFQGFVPSWNW